MVKIAIVGATGNVARGVTDTLLATGKHELLLLTRKNVGAEAPKGATWITTDYQNLDALTETLRGVDTVLSFIISGNDPGNVTQKNLIDASVRAGVRRFAPSEWAGSGIKDMPWYDGKGVIREYLRELNKDKKVLEYSLFHCGFFTDYLCHPYNEHTPKNIQLFETMFDFERRRALVPEGYEDARITLTTADDLSKVVALAMEYEGEWPLVSGIKGTELTVKEIIALGEKIRGGPFKVERLKEEDLRAGIVRSPWVPKIEHPSLSPEEIEAMATVFVPGLLLGIAAGNLHVSDEWNRLLPGYKFTQAEEFLVKTWAGKP